MDLYVANEKHDGYIRDACLWRKDINIYDKMAVQAKYANNAYLSYSLTTYSPYEGWRIAFNGTKGRIDSWLDIPWQGNIVNDLSQEELHKLEMKQKEADKNRVTQTIMVMDNFGDYETVNVTHSRSGHGGGDSVMQDMIFKDPNMPDPYKHKAGTRDGAMSILLGIAARTSIEKGKSIKVGDLTDLKPQAKRPT